MKYSSVSVSHTFIWHWGWFLCDWTWEWWPGGCIDGKKERHGNMFQTHVYRDRIVEWRITNTKCGGMSKSLHRADAKSIMGKTETVFFLFIYWLQNNAMINWEQILRIVPISFQMCINKTASRSPSEVQTQAIHSYSWTKSWFFQVSVF